MLACWVLQEQQGQRRLLLVWCRYGPGVLACVPTDPAGLFIQPLRIDVWAQRGSC